MTYLVVVTTVVPFSHNHIVSSTIHTDILPKALVFLRNFIAFPVLAVVVLGLLCSERHLLWARDRRSL